MAVRTELRTRAADERETLDALRAAAEDLPPPERAHAFGERFDRFGDAKLALLGEATHGTSEFYRARAAISRRLIVEHGFSLVAVEADWPDAARIDRYVRHLPGAPPREEAFSRFPSWMWRNVEVLEFVDWLRAHNAGLEKDSRVEFRGLDIYSLKTSIAAVLAYLDKVDPAAAKIARYRYGCLTPWQSEPSRYGHRALMGGQTCEKQVRDQLLSMLERRIAYAARDGESFFDAAQNARVVRAAEEYYRVMYLGSKESWNLRDRHMFVTLQALIRRRGRAAKAIVWAHNSHIGNAAATSMGWEGEFNIGELCRAAYGDDMVAIGFGCDTGAVAAASDWGSPMKVMPLNPARPGSFERLFGHSGHARSLTDFRPPQRARLRELLSEPRLERAIGVVYRPDSELLSHYFRASLSEQFDAYVWFEKTRPVTPLEEGRPEGAPETWPFGL